MAQGAIKNLHLRHQETWSVPTSCTTKHPSGSTGATKQPSCTTKVTSGGTEKDIWRRLREP